MAREKSIRIRVTQAEHDAMISAAGGVGALSDFIRADPRFAGHPPPSAPPQPAPRAD